MRFAIRSCLAGAAALFFALGPAAAAEPDSGLITAFTVENVSSFLTESGGANLKADKDDEGNPVIVARFPDGPVVATLVTCEGTPACATVQFAMYFDNKNPSFNTDLANEYNRAWLDATAIIEKDGSLTLATVVRATGGITRGNLAEYFTHFMEAPSELTQTLTSRMQVSYAPSKARARPAPAKQGYLLRRTGPPLKQPN